MANSTVALENWLQNRSLKTKPSIKPRSWPCSMPSNKLMLRASLFLRLLRIVRTTLLASLVPTVAILAQGVHELQCRPTRRLHSDGRLRRPPVKRIRVMRTPTFEA